MPKGKAPGAISGSDPVVKFVKFLSWGKVAQLKNAPGSHRLTSNWIDTAMPWFRSYYERVYDSPLTDIRLLNIVSTLVARYAEWPECERVRTYELKSELQNFLEFTAITESDIRNAIGLPESQEISEAAECDHTEGPLDGSPAVPLPEAHACGGSSEPGDDPVAPTSAHELAVAVSDCVSVADASNTTGLPAHRDMYIVEEFCPECGEAPLREGHICDGELICPKCKQPVGNQDHRAACPDCPLCFYCCAEDYRG